MQTLILFSTESLLRLVPVCHRFQGLILRILHGRLLMAASLKDRRLILDCYHPSAQYTEPYLSCDYLGTPGLSDEIKGQGLIYDGAGRAGCLGQLRGLYSRFRPSKPDIDPPFRSHPAGETPGTRTFPAVPSAELTKPTELVAQTIHLDSHELFSQLCISVK